MWQLDETRHMALDTKATTWAVFQCQYGGLSHKPTKIVSNIPGSKSLKYAKCPSFTKLGQYMGPLPFKCGHKWHVKKLIGKSKDGRFQTAPSAAYPAGLCMFLAELISSVLRKGENELQSRYQGVSTATTLAGAGTKQKAQGQGDQVMVQGTERSQNGASEHSRNRAFDFFTSCAKLPLPGDQVMVRGTQHSQNGASEHSRNGAFDFFTSCSKRVIK